MLTNYGDILTTQDVCDILFCGRNTVYALLSSGELCGFRVGKNNWRIPKVNLEKYIIQKCRATN